MKYNGNLIPFVHCSPTEETKTFLTTPYKYHKDGHLPWVDGQNFAARNIEFTEAPYDEATCRSVETREVMFAFTNNRVREAGNCYSCNQGHLTFNVITPLFSYLFFVREGHTKNVYGRNVSIDLFPLQSTLLLYKGEIPKKPAYLYDFVTRFAQSYEPVGTYFREKNDGATYCFSRVTLLSTAFHIQLFLFV